MDLEVLATKLSNNLKTCIGYPLNNSYDFSEIVNILNIPINNVGSPYILGIYKTNTKDIEIEIIKYFADLWGLDKDSIFSYLTSGGTESNMQGLYIGRESLSDNTVFYTSEDSHYSIFKIARILKLNLCLIKSYENGEINYEDFEEQLLLNLNKDVLINLNLGTTIKCAFDNPNKIHDILEKYNINKNNIYIHCDAALMGFPLCFMENDISFKKHINSMCISLHKFLGIPFPCSIFLMEKDFLSIARLKNNIEYIASDDCTITSSRNGHAPIFIKHILEKKSHEDFKKEVETCINNADYLVSNIPNSWKNINSFTVIFPKPNKLICDKYQLAIEKDNAHIICMQHVTREILDKFITDYLIYINK